MKQFIKQILKEYHDEDLSNSIFEFINEFSSKSFESLVYYPYMTPDETPFIIKIDFHVSRVRAWRAKSHDQKYEGTAYIVLDDVRLCEFTPESQECDQLYEIDDIPEFVFDDLPLEIEDSVFNFFNCDLDFDITFPKK